MYQRFFRPPQYSYFLFGPRGTGKSTWLKQHYSHAYWVDLNDPETFRFYAASPERLKKILFERSERIVVIDQSGIPSQLKDRKPGRPV